MSGYKEMLFNGSGYYDGTAYAAMRNIEREERKKMNRVEAKPGEIWKIDATYGEKEILILNAHDSYANAITLFSDQSFTDNADEIQVHSKTLMYANCGKVFFVRSAQMIGYVKSLPGKEFKAVQEKVAECLGLAQISRVEEVPADKQADEATPEKVEIEPAAIPETIRPKDEYDSISHPKHYCFGRFEPKDVIRDWGLNFNLGSAVKYIPRAGRKGDMREDLQKAAQFLEFEIDAIDAESVRPE